MKTATVRDLRTSFPRVEAWLAEGEDVIITKGGRPVAQLTRPPVIPKQLDFAKRFGGQRPKSVAADQFSAADLLSEERGE